MGNIFRLAILTILLHPSAHAIVGYPGLVTEGGHEAICRVIERDPKGMPLQVCTGTRISSNQVLTASHCISQSFSINSVYVQCGYLGYEPGAEDPIVFGNTFRFVDQEAKFKDTVKVSAFQRLNSRMPHELGMRTFDQALLTLERPMKGDAILINTQIPRGVSANCYLAGYGLDQQEVAGKLHMAAINFIDRDETGIQISSTHLIGIVEAGALRTLLDMKVNPLERIVKQVMRYGASDPGATHVLPGDSGGGILCIDPTTNKWSVGAIITSVSVNDLNESGGAIPLLRFDSLAQIVQMNLLSQQTLLTK